MTFIKEKMDKFNQRWKLSKIDINPQEEFLKFKRRILNFLSDIDQHVSEASVSAFCNYYGIPEIWINDRYSYQKWSGPNIIDKLKNENDPVEFYRLLEVIFSLDINTQYSIGGHSIEYSNGILYQKLQQSIQFSNIDLAVKKLEEGEIIFYSKGEEIFDEELVNKPLDFLDEKSNKHFIDALKFYQAKNYIKSAESLRRTLEEFLRFKLNNQKGLQANKDELGKSLKSSVDSQIRNVIIQVFGYLDQYFNENSKHNDGELDDAENEFLIYQVGLLLRYINQVI